MAKNLGGRPTSMTEEVMTKLEHAFACNCNITEACLYAGICTRTLTRYIEKNPEYCQKIDALRSHPRMTAKLNVKNKLVEGDVDTSKWVLNHTDPDYKPKSKIDQEVKIGAHKSLIEAILEKKNTRGCDDC